jgi:hypothetical protein
MTDPALFEITPEERVAKVRVRLEELVDKAEKRVEKAEEKAAAASAELAEFDAAIEALQRSTANGRKADAE